MKKHYPGLDGIRGIAALFVCVLHVSVWGIGPAWGIHIGRSVVAVDLFFILSGFVIASSYEQRLANGSMTTKAFILTRLIRLYPMYLISLLLAIAVHVDVLRQQGNIDRVLAVLASAVWLPWKMGDSKVFFPFNIACWSLFFELLVNVLYVLSRRWLTDSVLLALVLVLAAALVLLVHRYGMDLGPYWNSAGLLGGLVRAMFGIAAGVLLFRKRLWLPHWLTGKGGYVLPLTVIVLLLAVPPITHIENSLMLAAVLFIFPWCVLCAARGANIQGRKAAVLEFLGAISYPLYLLHLPLWLWLCRLIPSELEAAGPVLAIVSFVTLVVASTAVVERYVERPLRSQLRSWVFGVPRTAK